VGRTDGLVRHNHPPPHPKKKQPVFLSQPRLHPLLTLPLPPPRRQVSHPLLGRFEACDCRDERPRRTLQSHHSAVPRPIIPALHRCPPPLPPEVREDGPPQPTNLMISTTFWAHSQGIV
jgi:hypothetical protein